MSLETPGKPRLADKPRRLGEPKGRWSDLGPRTVSAGVLLAIGGLAISLGGFGFAIFVAIGVGVVTWELVRMFEPGKALEALGCGAATCFALLLASGLPLLFAPLLVGLSIYCGFVAIEDRRKPFLWTLAWVLIGGFGLIWLRDSYWVGWIFWLIFVVVATDVAGYFVGKRIGGPKLWARVSPNKTWSGTCGGWGAAALVGCFFSLVFDVSGAVIVLSVFISMASQAGDISQSAIKRLVGVKDSSAMIPGHGGVFDRFDGMLGAGALCFVLAIVSLG